MTPTQEHQLILILSDFVPVLDGDIVQAIAPEAHRLTRQIILAKLEEEDEYRRQEFLKRIRDYDDSITPTMRQNGYKRIDATERTVLFTFGEITFSRNRWRRG